MFRGDRYAWLPLLSAFRFAEFATSLIHHVLTLCIGSFLLQDMYLRIGFQEKKSEISRDHVAYLQIAFYCDDGPGCD